MTQILRIIEMEVASSPAGSSTPQEIKPVLQQIGTIIQAFGGEMTVSKGDSFTDIKDAVIATGASTAVVLIRSGNSAVSDEASYLTKLINELRKEVEEAGDVNDDTKFDALKDSEVVAKELEKKAPRLDRVIDMIQGIGRTIASTVDTATKLSDLVTKIQQSIPPGAPGCS